MFSFDSRQKDGLGLGASRGVGSPEVWHVEEEEQSREMVGFALVVAVRAALPSREVPAAILFVLSGLGLVWALFFAPVWCGAVTRKHGPCHNNSWGLLMGHLREHRWQKFKMMFVNRQWQQLNRGLWPSPPRFSQPSPASSP